MKTFAAAVLATATSATMMTQVDYEFMHYVAKFNKVYATIEEYEARFLNWAKNDQFIKKANAKANSYRAGHNKFSDFTDDEYKNMLGFNVTAMPELQEATQPEIIDLPESFDWRDEGMVTPVKDQGACGSCWAFSATEAVESAWMIAGGEETILSPQQLVDCSWDQGNNGCNGGFYFWAYDYLKDHKHQTDASYPYTASDGTCVYDESEGVTNVASYNRVNGVTNNLNALAQQPVNVAVSAGNDVFRNYAGGVVTADDGCPQQCDHAIVAVGWGVEDGVQYYIVRNSWGDSWGLDGYIHIATEGGILGVCGINEYVYYPNL